MKPRALAALVALVTLISGHQAASAAPVSLDALLQSFDQALAIVSEAAEQRIAEIEQRGPTQAPRLPRLADLEAEIDVACDIASDVLDYTISTTELTSFQRSIVRACVDRHVWEARRDLEAETDPRVRTEYLVTYERLQEVRRMI